MKIGIAQGARKRVKSQGKKSYSLESIGCGMNRLHGVVVSAGVSWKKQITGGPVQREEELNSLDVGN